MALGVGIVGYGFIGKVHAFSHWTIPWYYTKPPVETKLVGVCTSRPETAEAAKKHGGFEFCTTDYRDILARDDIQIVHCCTPNSEHAPFLLDALKAGKHIYCDKPITKTVDEAETVWAAAKDAKTIHQMTFNYRFAAPMLKAKELTTEGALGRVFTFRAAYLHAGYVDPTRPMSWRLTLEKGGAGAVADLGAHIFDLVRYLLGDITAVNATLETMIKERPFKDGGVGKVEVDDMAFATARLADGALGTFEASRLATGAQDELRLEIHGSKGAISFNLMDPNWLDFYDNTATGSPLGGRRGFTRIETVQRYPDAGWPGPKFSPGWLRFHVASVYDFLSNVAAGRQGAPSFADGLACQRVIDACQRSSEKKTWVEIEPVT